MAILRKLANKSVCIVRLLIDLMITTTLDGESACMDCKKPRMSLIILFGFPLVLCQLVFSWSSPGFLVYGRLLCTHGFVKAAWSFARIVLQS
ncbi:hypothetical protein BU24DRAFT_47735 [Aaosphaeria arxii CBS 175.79]|uniref:Uncharacterized protein n=1 Tax=Aaosphaeria arxii CBS 175.79 TaxID=1450172 RepID=A0A6A5XD79_9PLEO|nr:uncharacterized protein BU24DRAFT_47735 [Aaosphaeria arxii CBS 175.79]KAF2010861.1 hypothetical protein BU24DRAFT_47735 [Aaosphaeria arxii CBS 175.79]